MSTNLYGYKPSKVTVVKHHNRDITFMIPQVEPEVGFLQANYDKRLATAVKWASERFRDPITGNFGTGEPIITEFENTSLKGYTIETLNGRYRTEVEYILVRHPEGYIFEVPFQNLLDIIKEVGCGVGGVIEKPCYVQAVGGKWRLVPVGGSMEEEAISGDKEIRALYAKKVSNSKKKLSVGDVIKMRDSEGYWVYVGKHKMSADVEYEGSVWENDVKPDSRGFKTTDTRSMACVRTSKVKSIGGSFVSVTHQLKGGGEDSGRHHFKLLDETYMVFVRIKGVSKSQTLTNEDFMKDYKYVSGVGKQEVQVDSEVCLFKGKSVQFEHTGETDTGSVEEFLKGSVSYGYKGVSNIASWDLFFGWRDLVTHNRNYPRDSKRRDSSVHRKGVSVKVGDNIKAPPESAFVNLGVCIGDIYGGAAELLLKYDPV